MVLLVFLKDTACIVLLSGTPLRSGSDSGHHLGVKVHIRAFLNPFANYIGGLSQDIVNSIQDPNLINNSERTRIWW